MVSPGDGLRSVSRNELLAIVQEIGRHHQDSCMALPVI